MTEQEIIDAHLDGESVQNIADRLGRSSFSIRKMLKAAGAVKENGDGFDEYELEEKRNRATEKRNKAACFSHLADLYREHGRRSPMPALEQA